MSQACAIAARFPGFGNPLDMPIDEFYAALNEPHGFTGNT